MAWTMLAIQVGLALVSLAVTYAMRDKAPPPDDLPEFNPGDQIPRITESAPIPVVFGTRMIADPNVVYIGDAAVAEEAVSTGGGGLEVNFGTKPRYRLDLVFAVCVGPIDIIHRIDIDGKLALGDLTGTPAIDVSDGIADTTKFGELDFFGSDWWDRLGDDDDGFAGWIDTIPGTPTQNLVNYERPDGTNAALYDTAAHGQLRNICSVTLRGQRDADDPGNLFGALFYHGTSPRLRPWRFFVQRINRRMFNRTPWYASKVEIQNASETTPLDMNPAHIAREILVDHAGFDEADIDDTAFQAAADTFHTEKIGMSLLWNAESTFEDLIREIERTTDSIIRYDAVAEKWTIKPMREAGGTIPTLDESNVVSVNNFVPVSHHDLPTSVELVYWDRSEVRERVYTVHNPAAVYSRGRVIKETVKYSGVVSRSVVSKLAHRDMSQLTSPRTQIELSVSYTEGVALQRGDSFKLTWPEYALTDVLFRVTSINYGKLEDDFVVVEAMSDVVYDPVEYYDPPQDSEHPDPTPPTGSGETLATELPIWLWNEYRPLADYPALVDHVFEPIDVDNSNMTARGMYLQARPRLSGANPDFTPNGFDLFERVNGSPLSPEQKDRSSFAPTVYVSNTVNRNALFGGEIPTLSVTSYDWSPQVGDLILFECDNPLVNPTIAFTYDGVNDPGGTANANVTGNAGSRSYDFSHLATGTQDVVVVVAETNTAPNEWDITVVRGCLDTSPAETITAPGTINLQGRPEGFVIGRINVTPESVDEWFEAGRMIMKTFAIGDQYEWESRLLDSPTVLQQRGLNRGNGRQSWADASSSEETPTLGDSYDATSRDLHRVLRPLPAGAVQIDDDVVNGVEVWAECRNRTHPAFFPAGLSTVNTGLAVNESADLISSDVGWEDTATNVEVWYWDGDTGDILLVQNSTTFGTPESGATAGFTIAEEQAMHNALHGTSQQFDKIRYAVVVTNGDYAQNSEFDKRIPCYLPFFGMIDRT